MFKFTFPGFEPKLKKRYKNGIKDKEWFVI